MLMKMMKCNVDEFEYIMHFGQLLNLKGTECVQDHSIRALRKMKVLITEVSDFQY